MDQSNTRHHEPPFVPQERVRGPLLSQTNFPRPVLAASLSKTIHRKPSFIQRIDSSEEFPTSHESIFQAEYFSKDNSEDNGQLLSELPTVILNPAAELASSSLNLESGENREQKLKQLNVDNMPIIYGHGTALSTISEQKSNTTIGTKSSDTRSKSLSNITIANISTPNLLGHRNSFDLPSSVTIRSPRKRRSFSADDLILIKRSYHEACITIERITHRSLSIHEIYAKPLTPLIPPIDRPGTPPGIPSWTAAQSRARPPQPVTRTRLQRFLGIEPSRSAVQSRIFMPLYQSRNQGGDRRSVSNPLPARIAPRFRPQRSGHGTGLLDNHPFLRVGQVGAKVIAQTTTQVASSRPARSQNTIVLRNMPPATGETPVANAHCRHHRSRVLALSGPTQAQILAPIRYTPLVSNGSEQEPGLHSTSSQISTEPQDQFSHSLRVIGAALGAPPISDSSGSGIVTSKPGPERCWKCRTATLLTKLDDLCEDGASWCCWVFCGVDINEDYRSFQRPDIHLGRYSSSEGVILGPRRVLIDRSPVTLE